MTFHLSLLRRLSQFAARTDAKTSSSPLSAARDKAHLEITVENRIDARLIPQLWDIYARSFEPLAERALLDHFYSREVFEALIEDPRTFKIIAWLDDRPVGVAVSTSELSLVPQISPAFLVQRYPEHASRNAIYFGVFVCVDESVRASSAFARMVASLAQIAATHDGIVVFDVSQSSSDAGVDRMLHKVSTWFPNSSFEEIDAQRYFAGTLPEPIEHLPFSRRPMPEIVIDIRDRPDDDILNALEADSASSRSSEDDLSARHS